MKTNITAVIASALLTSACMSSGVIINEQQVQQFKRGETTEAQIVAALGRPTTVTNVNGQRSISYTGVHAQTRPESFIPYIGGLVGGSDVRHSSYTFRFDAYGKLADIISSESEMGTGTGFAAGAPAPRVEAQPRRPD